MVLALAATSALAQESERPLRWQGFETNRFWDNWEISAAGGNSVLQVSRNMKDEPGSFFKRNGWNANVAATKWIVPTLGMRLQVDGGEFRNYSFNKGLYGEDPFKTPYIYVHGDVLVNMSNWIGGYRPDRVYSAVSYLGCGYTAMSWTKKSAGTYNGELAVTMGLLNKFHITPQWDVELDLRTWMFAEKSLPAEIQSGGRYAFALSASLGVAYRFNQRVWTPAYSQFEVDGYIAAIVALEEQLIIADGALNAAGAKVASLESDNNRLKSELDASKSRPVARDYGCAGESVVFFTIGEAELTDYAKATLDTFIAKAMCGDADIVVTGYADKETGSAQRNEQLSMERAEAVAAYLSEAGVDAERLITQWVGDSEVAFASPDTPLVNRCVIIK